MIFDEGNSIAPPAAVKDDDLLFSLTAPQLELLDIGLTINFGARLAKFQDHITVTLQSGKRIGVHSPTITVVDLWRTVELMSE